jgi:pimeloyl-ACP methyl ester carboxylesterase
MIAFDPQGQGDLPLNLYKSLSEKYGFILLGSNDSKNGLHPQETNGIVKTLMDEVHTVYPVDTNRVYLLGFSGGARVAAMAAMYQVPVKGVIGCGAGFGSGEQPVLYKFDYFGFAGTADFNMNEILQLDDPLSQAGFRHYITTFTGKHAWPPVEVMEDAFTWITLNAMKDGELQNQDGYVAAVSAGFEARITNSTSNKHLIAAADACKEAITFLDGLAPVDIFQVRLQQIEKRAEYRAQVAYRSNVLKQEEEEKQELMQALQSKDLDWWNDWTTRHAPRVTRHDFQNPEDTLKDCRLMAFLSLFCYMNANAAMAKQDETSAVKIIAVYEMADPGNPEPNYLRAILFARRSDTGATIDQLNVAASKGFTEKSRLTQQPEFQSLKNLPEWFDLLKKMNR